MGIIKDGSISGVLPSSSKVFAVHYPGYPSSTERAIETLGGNQGILKVRTEKSNKLELHFRPEDPYSHPAFGELHPCNNFLLKLSKKKVKDEQSTKELSRVPGLASTDSFHLKQNISIPESTENTEPIIQPEVIKNESQEQLSADIVATVSEAYHFNGMADYQHVLAVHADLTRKKKRTWTEVESYDEGGLLDVDQDDLMIIVPPLFSLKDRPEKVALKPLADMGSKKKPEAVGQQHSEMEIEQCLAIDFNIKEIPKKVNWENSIPRDSDRWQWQTAVCELFDARPIWVKASLAEHLLDRGLNIGNKILRRLLFIAAYYFGSGPYRRFWIRKGYDPRKDPESRIYQRTDFRVPPALRSYCFSDVERGLRTRWEDICAFRAFPHKSQTLLQLYELQDDYIQQEIRKPPSQENCSLQTGWFSSQLIDCLRLRVAQRFLSVYPEPGAAPFLKSVCNRFERTKRLHLNPKDTKVDGEGKEADKEVLESEDKEEDREINDEVEYDEDEEDEMEDDMEADEALELGDQDMDFPLPDSFSDHENVSKDYLQELFGSFPFGGGGGGGGSNGMQDDVDPLDGAYQIYDDENYSDDDEDDEDEDY